MARARGGEVASSEEPRQQIRVDFPGLLRLLSTNLYSDPDMFIREVIQNSHDAILARRQTDKSFEGRIKITSDRATRSLKFSDNGCGMTRSEIVQHLSTIGASSKKSIPSARPQDPLIGQFGIGFMSALLVARRLAVETLSIEPGSEALRWSMVSENQYELTTGNRSEPGTELIIELASEHLRFADREVLEGAIRKYVDFLQFPIDVNGTGPVNALDAPWHRTYSNEVERQREFAAFVKSRFGHDSLEVIPIDFDAPYPARGVLSIPDLTTTYLRLGRHVDIYQARMFVKRGDQNLLPEWATFACGVIDSPSFTPTAARDAVIADQIYEGVGRALGRALIDALQFLATDEPLRFRRFAEAYPDTLKWLAVQFDELFEPTINILQFRVNITEGTAQREITLAQYCEAQPERDSRSRKVIYYITDEIDVGDFQRFFAAKSLLVIYAKGVSDYQLLQKFAERNAGSIALQGVDVSQLDPLLERLSESERLRYLDLEYRLQTLLRASFPEADIGGYKTFCVRSVLRE
jgi:molecular chaperone HtpG